MHLEPLKFPLLFCRRSVRQGRGDPSLIILPPRLASTSFSTSSSLELECTFISCLPPLLAVLFTAFSAGVPSPSFAGFASLRRETDHLMHSMPLCAPRRAQQQARVGVPTPKCARCIITITTVQGDCEAQELKTAARRYSKFQLIFAAATRGETRDILYVQQRRRIGIPEPFVCFPFKDVARGHSSQSVRRELREIKIVAAAAAAAAQLRVIKQTMPIL